MCKNVYEMFQHFKSCSSFKVNLRSKLLKTLSKAASKGTFASAAMLDVKQTASVCRIFDVIVLLHPPRSVIGPLSQAKICSMVSRLPCARVN